MGMTDKQFETYQADLLHLLEIADSEIKASGARSQTLERLIKNIDSALKKP